STFRPWSSSSSDAVPCGENMTSRTSRPKSPFCQPHLLVWRVHLPSMELVLLRCGPLRGTLPHRRLKVTFLSSRSTSSTAHPASSHARCCTWSCQLASIRPRFTRPPRHHCSYSSAEGGNASPSSCSTRLNPSVTCFCPFGRPRRKSRNGSYLG